MRNVKNEKSQAFENWQKIKQLKVAEKREERGEKIAKPSSYCRLNGYIWCLIAQSGKKSEEEVSLIPLCQKQKRPKLSRIRPLEKSVMKFFTPRI